MNNKQRSSNDEPNRDSYSAKENQIAERTVRVLELRSLENQSQNAHSKDDQATAELGRVLRDAAETNLPESNGDLREQLMAEFGGGSSVTQSDRGLNGTADSTPLEAASRSTGRRFWITAAASGLILVGGAIAYNSGFVGQLSNVAMFEAAKESKFEVVERSQRAPIFGSSNLEKPEVVFRMETRTRTGPNH